MITLRCTKRFLAQMGVVPDKITLPTTALLGDWYINLIPVFFGEIFLFMNEKSLLTTVIPGWESINLLRHFRKRVANLLLMIGIPLVKVNQEISQLDQIQFGRTANRSLLGSMNDFAWNYQIMLDEVSDKSDFKVSNFEYKMSQMPCKPLNYQSPQDAAMKLFGIEPKNA